MKGSEFPFINGIVAQSEVPRLHEKPLVVAGHTSFEDLGVSWVNVGTHGCSMLFDHHLRSLDHVELHVSFTSTWSPWCSWMSSHNTLLFIWFLGFSWSLVGTWALNIWPNAISRLKVGSMLNFQRMWPIQSDAPFMKESTTNPSSPSCNCLV